MGYKSGELDVGKREIKEIIHKSLKGAIYLTAGDNLTWDEEENLCKHWYRATTEAINLLTPAKMTIKDPLERNRALKMLAAGLARALQATTPNPDEDFLASAREFILARRQEILQIRYFAAAVVVVVMAAILLALLITMVFNDDKSNVKGTAADHFVWADHILGEHPSKVQPSPFPKVSIDLRCRFIGHAPAVDQIDASL